VPLLNKIAYPPINPPLPGNPAYGADKSPSAGQKHELKNDCLEVDPQRGSTGIFSTGAAFAPPRSSPLMVARRLMIINVTPFSNLKARIILFL
jgi:hypothetical protein